METKKNYRKPEFEEIVLNANMSLMAGSCDTGGGNEDGVGN